MCLCPPPDEEREKIADFVPNDGCLNFVEQIDEVLIAEFGLKRHVVGDIPCGRFKVVMVSGVSQRDLFLLLTVTIKNKFMFPAKKLAGPSKKKEQFQQKKIVAVVTGVNKQSSESSISQQREISLRIEFP